MAGIGPEPIQQPVHVGAVTLDGLKEPPVMTHQHPGQPVSTIVALRLAEDFGQNQQAGRGVADGVADVEGAVERQGGNSN